MLHSLNAWIFTNFRGGGGGGGGGDLEVIRFQGVSGNACCHGNVFYDISVFKKGALLNLCYQS